MLKIVNNSTNPYFNLAAEEYVLKKFDEECFMLWRNEPCIVVGKNQNTLSEINEDYVKENNIIVVRRLSGGGAVFHDLGNLNFTFVANDDSKSFSDFKKFTQPIIDVLKTIDINAEFTGRNDLTIDGKKFSGNAQYKYKNRIFHHGTLLFTSNIKDLSGALKVKKDKFKDKAVKSVKSRVTNISKHLKSPLTINEFMNLIMEHISKNPNVKEYIFTNEDIKNINKLVEDRYSKWEWNFGKSPKYTFKNEKKFKGGIIEAYLYVNKGIIESIDLYGDFFSAKDITDITKALTGIKHSREAIIEALSSYNINDYFSNITLEEFMSLF
ncbi:lipoate--protein ligase [Abyssisolibacter fermentans]|uniref:lipoate--protein ligase n=1 Tax=Abyssisolibacter fermentans TaxID=1766203 RepID=UPI00082A0C93|nr:lipoate--protein ligase [Abyssisolibacter fermentans]